MSLPPVTDRRWRDVIVGNVTYDFDFLALQFFFGRIRMQLARDSSEANIMKYIGELHVLLTKNAHLTNAKRDIAKIFGVSP